MSACQPLNAEALSASTRESSSGAPGVSEGDDYTVSILALKINHCTISFRTLASLGIWVLLKIDGLSYGLSDWWAHNLLCLLFPGLFKEPLENVFHFDI